MKVLNISSDYLPNIGGIASHAYYLSKYLDRDVRVKLDVLFGYKYTTLKPPMDFRGVYLRKGRSKFKGLAYLTKFVPILAELHRKNSYDILHCHNFIFEGLLAALGKDLGVRYEFVFTNHSSQFLDAVHKKKRILGIYKYVINRSDLVICPSEELKDVTLSIAGKNKKVRYIPNGVDLEKFRFKADQNKSEPYLLLTRRHEEKNGLIDFIEALKIVKSVRSDFKVILAGDGSLRESLQKMVLKDGLNNVEFIGSKTHEELVELYAGALATCLPSHYEAVSISGLESLACGTPIVGTNVGGIPALVDEGLTGFLANPQDPESFAKAILQMLELKDSNEQYLTMRKNCRQKVEAGYSWEAVAQMTIKEYEDLLA